MSDQQVRKRGWKSLQTRTRIALSAAATLITVAVIAIPIVAGTGKERTNTDTIDVTNSSATDGGPAEPTTTEVRADVVGLGDTTETESDPDSVGIFDGAIDTQVESGSVLSQPDEDGMPIYYLVPLDAPWALLPTLEEPGWCSQEQLGWFEQYALNPNSILGSADVSMRNTADAGPHMTIRNIRLEGNLSPNDAQFIPVLCKQVGGFAYIVQHARASFDGTPAVWELYEGMPAPDGARPDGEIVSLSLAPGELKSVTVDFPELYGQIFEGNIVADVIVGEDEATVVLVDDFVSTLVSTVHAQISAVQDVGVFGCDWVECTHGELVEFVGQLTE